MGAVSTRRREDHELSPFGAQLRALMDERGLTAERLARRTARYDKRGDGVSTPTIKSWLASPSARKFRATPEPEKLRLVAEVLEIPPETFPQYRLAMARQTLDERVVGLDEALRMLEQIERAMRPRQAAARLEAERSAANGQPRQADPRGLRSSREA